MPADRDGNRSAARADVDHIHAATGLLSNLRAGSIAANGAGYSFLVPQNGEILGNPSLSDSQRLALGYTNSGDVPPQHVRRMTSHEDVPATVLTYMGAENPLPDYTQGLPLMTNAARPFVFISSWSDAAIVSTNTITTFGLEAYNSDVAILGTNNVPQPNQRAALASHRSDLVAAMESMRQFKK